jgi:medium-chain acyl-[acyl-carrier-protein] hydrolase
MSGITQSSSPWLVRPRPVPHARLRLFCFPYAGGSAHVYRTWHEFLPAGTEVCAVQLPGRGGLLQQPPLKRLPEIVEAVTRVIKQQLDRPFAFFGHSMGAMIGFEVARRLRRERLRGPLALFVSARRAPQVTEAEPVTYNLPEAEFCHELRRLNGTPKEVLENAELMQLMTPVLRADFEVCQTYAYAEGAPLDCPVTAFGGLQDEEVPAEHLEPWREQTTARFTLRMLPGDHFFIHSSQALLLRMLSDELQRFTREYHI